ncbi:LacI family DNA-binding transcriptional regulator [Paenibacillus cremeus]|uniref:LacI family transcriptional regulator n=1 Tax=Paenibacillus cremeus TaxID=2163881 RepID=A0A559JFD3_9BACL|nr:LacI family DNA-binding transcriptional regulator [Paenibacillus cremeus]TVX98591.1 LacI family transcriptional regulator [Paenibacillus cremeus]
MHVTINDVAKLAGVSKTTVSRILNGNFKQSKEETKQKVLDAIRELDYRPNALAQGLKSMKTNVIAIVLSNLKNSFWTKVLEGVEDTCRAMNYQLMICNTNEDSALEREHIKGLQMRQVDGIIVNPTVHNNPFFETLTKSGFPLILINRKLNRIKANYVVTNNVHGGKLATQHFLKLGKTKITAFVYSSKGVSSWSGRIQGYREAMLEGGIPPELQNVVEVDEEEGSSKKAVLKLCSGDTRPEAIFSTNNMMTLEIIEGIQELGLRMPEDIAIIGYDETPWSRHLSPPLTTINQPAYEMGRLAAEGLIRLIRASRQPRPKTVTLVPDIIIRRSCGTKSMEVQ